MLDVNREADIYDLAFEAIITAVDDGWVTLDRSLFRPPGPDREADRGAIGGFPVTRVERSADGSLRHYVPGATAQCELSRHRLVRAEIDSERRDSMMRLDTAIHLAFFGYQSLYGPAEQLSMWLAPHEAWVDLVPSGEGPDDGAAAQIGEWVQRAIDDDLLISILTRPGKPDLTYWHVDGIGTTACSGLHPMRTGELGRIDIAVKGCPTGGVRLTATQALD